jgi:hypothetical protein
MLLLAQASRLGKGCTETCLRGRVFAIRHFRQCERPAPPVAPFWKHTGALPQQQQQHHHSPEYLR